MLEPQKNAINPDLLLPSYQIAVKKAFNHMIITDPDGTVLYANEAVTKITGYTLDEVIGSNPRLWGGVMNKEFYKTLWDTIKIKKKPFEGRIINQKKDGTKYHAKVYIAPILDKNKNIMGFIGTEEDVSQKNEAEKQMKELEYLRKKFVEVVSHQLRTPLGGMRWNLELLLENINNIDETERIIKYLYKTLNVVIDDINDMLLAIDVKEGRITLVRSKVKPVDVLNEELKKQKRIYPAKKISLKYFENGESSEFELDKEKFQFIVHTLIDNAFEYTKDNGEININLDMINQKLILTVKDNGLGIDDNDKDKVFTMFMRTEAAVKANPDASGVGLSIAKQFAELHDGNITFTSTKGQGSTFTVELAV